MSGATLTMADGSETFEADVFAASDPCGIVLFGVGGGGDPRRHAPLLERLSGSGFIVVAPHFARLGGPRATPDEVILRARRLRAALAALELPELPAIGVGHSIGAATLLGLAGGLMWPDPSGPLPIEREPRLGRLVLFAPAGAFFMAPGALDQVALPVLIFGASLDTVTPPAQARNIAEALQGRASAEVRIVEGADHYSFMDVRPPGIEETLADRETFLRGLARDTGGFALHGGAC